MNKDVVSAMDKIVFLTVSFTGLKVIGNANNANLLLAAQRYKHSIQILLRLSENTCCVLVRIRALTFTILPDEFLCGVPKIH